MYTRKNNWHGTPNFGYRVIDPPHSIKNVPPLNVSVSIAIARVYSLNMEEWVRLFEQVLNRILNISIQDSIFLRANLEAGDICDGRGSNERRLYSKASYKDKQSKRTITDAPPGIQSLNTTR